VQPDTASNSGGDSADNEQLAVHACAAHLGCGRADGGKVLHRGLDGAGGKHQALQQAVAGQPVGAVQPGARHLCRQENTYESDQCMLKLCWQAVQGQAEAADTCTSRCFIETNVC
jgi:hypothetical protein